MITNAKNYQIHKKSELKNFHFSKTGQRFGVSEIIEG